MLRVRSTLVTVALLGISLSGVAAEPSTPGAAELRAMAARFAPVEIRADISHLPQNERQALARLIEAARIMDTIYLRQVSAHGTTWLLSLLRDDSDLGRARLAYFLLNKGPWSELDANRPFLPGVGAKPAGGNFYPPDATREELERWLDSLPKAEREAAAGFFTTIRRDPAGRLVAIPYSVEFQGELTEAARLLREAARLTKQPTLARYLEKRAEAFLTNDYYESDVAWMELDASIEPTIGPYEVYEDELFNFKAAFEAFITVVDAEQTAQLARFAGELQELENNLPIDPQYRRAQLGGLAPIRVVNVVLTAGDANHGVQTAAFNLPNDERVVAEKGSKRVMLRNVQEAKFEKVLKPISRIVLAREDHDAVAFEPFFTHILMHELMHGLGPQTIRVGARETTVRQELKELNGPLEEAKADVSGLWALQYLMDKGVIDKSQERAMYVTFLASSFRTLRFGLGSAHARGMAVQLNHLLDSGAVSIGADGTFSLDLERAKAAVTELTRRLMTIQAQGDYAGAKELFDRMAVIRPQVQAAIDRLTDVPVDIAPRFVTAEELTGS
ncbi:MAG: hypothetical protein DIU56_004485 [Pseudomonadota bacterium]|jgi:Peptidase family M49.|nr:MAG: hypothetical protein DIU56_16615 [Pseudomonadota bacterium]